ncbi:MAG: histone deacetylase [Candidatus Saccharicenans sp.]|nr:histone deacetylase [Candidatus Saccharicenans sp.]MDI6849886.1 histone deacetylase [Candidatus Saccharicenans sp.]
MTTGIVFSRRFALHQMGEEHLESPLRIIALHELLETRLKSGFRLIEPRSAKREEIEMVHLPEYVSFLAETAGRDAYFPFDPDTVAGPHTYETACLAAGAGLTVADLILEGKLDNAFALVRPPGHHAESHRPLGFCFFNNIAITAEYLRHRKGIRRILIVDWDLHHGNGTQKTFYHTADVLYISLHQSPLFPGTGSAAEVGEKEGLGHNLNLPLRAGKTDEDYLSIFQKVILPVAESYQPEFVLVSAGFDIMKWDPLGRMELSARGCGDITRVLMEIAGRWASGRLLVFLEGGYNLKELREGVEEVCLSLSGAARRVLPDLPCPPALAEEIRPFLKIFRNFWPGIPEV